MRDDGGSDCVSGYKLSTTSLDRNKCFLPCFLAFLLSFLLAFLPSCFAFIFVRVLLFFCSCGGFWNKSGYLCSTSRPCHAKTWTKFRGELPTLWIISRLPSGPVALFNSGRIRRLSRWQLTSLQTQTARLIGQRIILLQQEHSVAEKLNIINKLIYKHHNFGNETINLWSTHLSSGKLKLKVKQSKKELGTGLVHVLEWCSLSMPVLSSLLSESFLCYDIIYFPYTFTCFPSHVMMSCLI